MKYGGGWEKIVLHSMPKVGIELRNKCTWQALVTEYCLTCMLHHTYLLLISPGLLAFIFAYDHPFKIINKVSCLYLNYNNVQKDNGQQTLQLKYTKQLIAWM